MSKHRKQRKMTLREAEYELFQRRIWREIKEHNFQFTPYKNLLPGTSPIKSTPAVQANKLGDSDVSTQG